MCGSKRCQPLFPLLSGPWPRISVRHFTRWPEGFSILGLATSPLTAQGQRFPPVSASACSLRDLCATVQVVCSMCLMSHPSVCIRPICRVLSMFSTILSRTAIVSCLWIMIRPFYGKLTGLWSLGLEQARLGERL